MMTDTGPCGDTLAWEAYREKPKATRNEKPVDGRTTPMVQGESTGYAVARVSVGWNCGGVKLLHFSNEHKAFCLFQQRRKTRRVYACAFPSSRCHVC